MSGASWKRIHDLEAERDALKAELAEKTNENTSLWIIRGQLTKERDALKTALSESELRLKQARQGNLGVLRYADTQVEKAEARVAELESYLAEIPSIAAKKGWNVGVGRESELGRVNSASSAVLSVDETRDAANPAAHYPLQREYDNMEQWLAACDAYRKRKPGAKV